MVNSMEFVDARAGAQDAAHRQLLSRSEGLRRTLAELAIRRHGSCWSYAHGLAQLARRLQRDAAECHHSVWHLSPAPLLEDASAVVPVEIRTASPLVDVRCAMPADSLTEKPWLKLCLGRYSGVLIAPVLQRSLLLDRSVVVYPGPLLAQGTQTFVATNHPDALERTEDVWRDTERAGTALRSHRPNRIDDRRMSVLTGLCRGSTDGQIARALGVSIRLIEMDVQHLKALCGARSRTQLVARMLAGNG